MILSLSRNQIQKVLSKQRNQIKQCRELSKSRKRRIPRRNDNIAKSRALTPHRREVKPLPSLSEVLTSPKVHKKLSNTVAELKSNILERMPDSFKRRVTQHQGPVMDEEWWKWNVALALTPAIFVALVCEYNRGDMLEYKRSEMMKANLKEYGDERVEEVDAEMLKLNQRFFTIFLEIFSFFLTKGRDLAGYTIDNDETHVESETNLDSHTEDETDHVLDFDEVTNEELLERIRRLEKALQIDDKKNNHLFGFTSLLST